MTHVEKIFYHLAVPAMIQQVTPVPRFVIISTAVDLTLGKNLWLQPTDKDGISRQPVRIFKAQNTISYFILETAGICDCVY